MSDLELSILMPGIRPHNWDMVYNSILKSTKRKFELIIVSPFPLTDYLSKMGNVKYVKDYGSPVRASCIGALICEGKYIYPTHSDDSVFIPNAIDDNLECLEFLGPDIKNIICCKYSESPNFSNVERYQPDEYYKLVNAYPVNKGIVPNDWWIFNSVFWHREYFDKFGGWDCSFQACPMAHADLAIRAQRDGAIVKLSSFPITQCDHGQNDHLPIEIAQGQYDTPKFIEKYNQPLDNFPIQIPRDNWKQADRIWKFRFNVS